jgi:drug/metabolite transporter (DMT)-like permease
MTIYQKDPAMTARTGAKPRPKVLAAAATALGGAVIVFIANQVGADIDPDIAYGMAAAAVAAFAGGYVKTDQPTP